MSLVELTSKEMIELREFLAYAIRACYGTKAARRRMAQLAEHKLLRAMLHEKPAEPAPHALATTKEPGCRGHRCPDGSCAVCRVVPDHIWVRWKQLQAEADIQRRAAQMMQATVDAQAVEDAASLTPAQLRLLSSGVAPYGSSQWRTAERLRKRGLMRRGGETTERGRAAVEASRKKS